MTPYSLIPKGMKQLLEEDYGQLITNNTIDLNQPCQITLIHVSGEDFFNTEINLTPKLPRFNFIPNQKVYP